MTDKMNFALGIIKKVQFLLIILTPIFFVSCAEYMMLDSEVREDFKPTEFIEEKKTVIAESVKLGPKPKSKTDSSLKKIDRRTFIDESIICLLYTSPSPRD